MMITKKSILNEMEVIIKDKLMVDLEKKLTFETNFERDGIALDSIMSLEFIVELEIKYDIEIDESELNASLFNNLGQFVDYIYDKIQQKETSCVVKEY